MLGDVGWKTAFHAGVIEDQKKPLIGFKIDLKVVNEIIRYVFTCIIKVMPQEIHSSITFPHDICSEGCVNMIILVACLK